jgi:hypothetical protein
MQRRVQKESPAGMPCKSCGAEVRQLAKGDAAAAG